MGFLDWAKPKPTLPYGYKHFTPKENIWYYYMSWEECEETDLEKRNLPDQVGWGCWEIRPFAFINGKKHRAKFKVVGEECIIEINKNKMKFPLNKCSFGYKPKYYHHKTINQKKRKEKDPNVKMTPSHYGEYHVTILVKD